MIKKNWENEEQTVKKYLTNGIIWKYTQQNKLK